MALAASVRYLFARFELQLDERRLLADGQAVHLGPRAFDLLVALVEDSGRLVTKDKLLARVWGKVVVEENALQAHISALRKVLGAEAIATVSGQGYRFALSVQPSGSHGPMRVSSAAARRSHNLPTGTTRIFGRSDAIDGLRRELQGSRLVSIVGAGGIGKTTVALAVAEHALGLFKDGVWLVDLALLKDPALAPNAMATAVGLAAHAASMLAPLCEFLRDREMLLVFDNCEHIIDAAAACANQILSEAAGVKILVTSREPLLVKGERVRRLPALGTPPPSSHLDAEEALTFPAIQLFVDRATDRLESFKLTDADAPVVAEICRRLDGLALAIEFAATRVDAFGAGGLLKQLDDSFRLLVGRRAGPERHRTLTATLDWSYGLLSASDATLLRAVSVFAGVFDIDGASVVSNVSPAETAHHLAQLAAKSLLSTELAAIGVTYRLLETTRAYSLERLRSSGEDSAVRRRHAEHLCELLERAAIEWPERAASEWGAAHGRYLDDLRAALAWAGQDTADPSLYIRLTVAGMLLWNHFSLTEECRAHVSRAVEALDAAGLAGTAAEMQLQVWLGGVTMFTQGALPAARAAMQRALCIAIQIDNTDGRVRCLRLIGVHETFTGEHDAAIQTFQNFASIAAADFPSAVLEAEVALGIAELFVGQLQDVRQRFERRHELDLQDINHSQSPRYHVRYLSDRIVDVTNLLSVAQWLTGSPDTALRTARESVEHALKTKHHLSLCNALSWVVPVFYWAGLYEECSRHVAMLDEQSRRHGFAVRRPVVMFYRAALACTQHGATAGVVDDFERALAVFHATGHMVRMPLYLGVVADCLVRRSSFGDAEIKIEAALDRARAKNEQWCVPELLRIQASVLTAQGQAKQAEPLLAEAMACAQEIGALSWRLRAASDLARLWRAQSRARDAREMLLPIYSRFTEGFQTRDLMVAADLLA